MYIIYILKNPIGVLVHKFFNLLNFFIMKKLNLANFKLKMASDDSNKQDLLNRLAGATQADCHDDDAGPLICCISTGGGNGGLV